MINYPCLPPISFLLLLSLIVFQRQAKQVPKSSLKNKWLILPFNNSGCCERTAMAVENQILRDNSALLDFIQGTSRQFFFFYTSSHYCLQFCHSHTKLFELWRRTVNVSALASSELLSYKQTGQFSIQRLYIEHYSTFEKSKNWQMWAWNCIVPSMFELVSEYGAFSFSHWMY